MKRKYWKTPSFREEENKHIFAIYTTVRTRRYIRVRVNYFSQVGDYYRKCLVSFILFIQRERGIKIEIDLKWTTSG